jgi:hypothetical protein
MKRHILAKGQKTTKSMSPSVRIERDIVAKRKLQVVIEILIKSLRSKYPNNGCSSSEKLRVVRAYTRIYVCSRAGALCLDVTELRAVPFTSIVYHGGVKNSGCHVGCKRYWKRCFDTNKKINYTTHLKTARRIYQA